MIFSYSFRQYLPRLRASPYREGGSDPLVSNESFPWALSFGLHSSHLRFNLMILWALEQLSLPAQTEVTSFRWVDVGSQDFLYAPALAAVSQKIAPTARRSLAGIELDPSIYYFDFYQRGQVAEEFVRLASLLGGEATYRQGDWLASENRREKADIVSCFFPFLFPDLHRRVGLPKKSYDPVEFYRGLLEASQKYLILFHQGAEERDESVRLLKTLGQENFFRSLSIKDNPYFQRKHPIEIVVIEK